MDSRSAIFSRSAWTELSQKDTVGRYFARADYYFLVVICSSRGGLKGKIRTSSDEIWLMQYISEAMFHIISFNFYWAEWDFMMLNILSKDKWELNLKYCTSIINPTSKLCCDFPDMSRPGLAFICISVVCGAESWHTISLYLAICPSVCHESQKNEESYK